MLSQETPLAIDVKLFTPSRVQWPSLLAVLQLAARWRAAQGAPVAGTPRAPSSPLGRLQGQGGGASRDASAAQVATLWSVVQREGAHRVRQGFVETLERWLEETTPGEEVDWAAARAAGERWQRFVAVEPEHGRLLLALARELVPGASWEAAALWVAEHEAPAALRARWGEAAARGAVGAVGRPAGAVGRPRRDVTAPPVEVERLAWGEARLTGAVDAWAGGA